MLPLAQFVATLPGPALVIGVVVLVLTILFWLGSKAKRMLASVIPFFVKVVTVVNDMFGQEARPGVPAQPGLMARMKSGEDSDAEIKAAQAVTSTALVAVTATLTVHSEALKELRPNHGGSMKDVLKEALTAIKAQSTQLTEQGAQIGVLESILSGHISSQQAAVEGAKAAVINADEAVKGAKAAVVDARAAVAVAGAQPNHPAASVNITVATP